MGLLGGDLPFARTLTVQDLEAFTALGTARSFAPGEHLFSEGDRTTHVLLILTGWSMVFTAVDRGATRLVLGLRGPDELLGELAALDQRPRSATVQALGAAQALVVPGEGFRRFLAENPRAGSRVMTQLASRLRDSDRERSALGRDAQRQDRHVVGRRLGREALHRPVHPGRDRTRGQARAAGQHLGQAVVAEHPAALPALGHAVRHAQQHLARGEYQLLGGQVEFVHHAEQRLRRGGLVDLPVDAQPQRQRVAGADQRERGRAVLARGQLAVQQGQEAAGLRGHTGRILAVTFNPDGTLLASGGEDGTVRLWRIGPEGRPAPLATLLGAPAGWAALLPSGAYKYEGDVAGEFWHAVGMCRFEPGELDAHLPGVHRLPPEAEL